MSYKKIWFSVKNCIPPEINLIWILLYEQKSKAKCSCAWGPFQINKSDCTIRRRVSAKSPCCSPLKAQGTVPLPSLNEAMGSSPPALKTALDSNITSALQFKSAMLIWSDFCTNLSVWGPHLAPCDETPLLVFPPLQYAVQEVDGSCSLRDGRCPSLEMAPSPITLRNCQ
jgi:hypothetical protein